MTRSLLALLACITVGALGLGRAIQPPPSPAPAAPIAPAAPAPAAAKPVPDKIIPSDPIFESVDVFVDSGTSPLSAYQFEFNAPERDGYQALIVGVEGGEHPAYAQAPYYDPAALQHQRVIIAAYSVQADLPAGRTRVARLHMMLKPLPRDKDFEKAFDSAAPSRKPGSPAGPGGTAPRPGSPEATGNKTGGRGLAKAPAPKEAESRYAASIITAADASGAAIPATISVTTGGTK